MNEFRLAERVVELCPEVMGMNRVAQEVVRDPRVVEALVNLVEEYIGTHKEWETHSQVLADQRDWANSEVKRLRKLFTWIEEEYEEDTLAGDIARKALAGYDG
jgi:hypothetical protein